MKAILPPLVITKPCSAVWEEMDGDDQRRFCAQCQRSAHNLSALTAREQRRFAERNGTRECIAYVSLADGRILARSWRDDLVRLLRPLRWAFGGLLAILVSGCATREKCAKPSRGVMTPGSPAPPPQERQLRGHDRDGAAVLGEARMGPGKASLVRGRPVRQVAEKQGDLP